MVRVLKEKEMKTYGEYQTGRLVLAAGSFRDNVMKKHENSARENQVVW